MLGQKWDGVEMVGPEEYCRQLSQGRPLRGGGPDGEPVLWGSGEERSGAGCSECRGPEVESYRGRQGPIATVTSAGSLDFIPSALGSRAMARSDILLQRLVRRGQGWTVCPDLLSPLWACLRLGCAATAQWLPGACCTAHPERVRTALPHASDWSTARACTPSPPLS